MNRDRAKRLLAHYITLLMRAADRNIDNDVYVEIHDIVDCIIDAAVEEMREEDDSS